MTSSAQVEIAADLYGPDIDNSISSLSRICAEEIFNDCGYVQTELVKNDKNQAADAQVCERGSQHNMATR